MATWDLKRWEICFLMTMNRSEKMFEVKKFDVRFEDVPRSNV